MMRSSSDYASTENQPTCMYPSRTAGTSLHEMKRMLHPKMDSFNRVYWSSGEVDLPEVRMHFTQNFCVQFEVWHSYLAA